MSESLANVRDAECTPVSEKVELSDAATVLILVSGLMPRTNSQFGSVWEFPHVELLLNVYLQYALADFWVHIKCKQRCSHHQPFARVGKGENLFVQRSASNCKNSSVQTKHLALPVGRAQDLYKFPTSEDTIPEVAAAVYAL